MIFEKYLFPDVKYKSVSDIDVEELKNRGIKFVILDIDNTLVPYTSPEPDEKALAFLDELKNNGITFCFVSNNNADRVNLFNRNIGAKAYPKGGKPLLFGINKAMKELGAVKSDTALIGDQVFTDTCGGKRAGIYTVLVDPIVEVTSAFFRFKRYFEKKIVKKYEELMK